MVKGIPTVYKGIRMRSRLEARYAAFFDELNWPWEYEPVDLDGYIPDYIIGFEHGELLFEVKGPDEELAGAELKLELSGWQGGAIIAAGQVDGPRIGRFLEYDPEVILWDVARLFYCLSCGAVSVHAAAGNWKCRSCGEGRSGGNDHVGEFDPAEAWVSATNRTQWRPGT